MAYSWRKFIGLYEFNLEHLILLWTELLGSFFIVLASTLTISQKHIDKVDLLRAAENKSSGASLEQISIGIGLVFAVVAQAMGRRSTCHFNPAVTMGFFVVGDIGLLMSLLFMTMQCFGSAAGVAAAKSLLPNILEDARLGVPLHPNVNRVGLFVIEMLITFAWVFLTRSAESQRKTGLRDTAPLAVGATITAGYLAAYRLTGASMNPARSFGSALVYMYWNDHWIYWIAALTGGILAGLTYDVVLKEKPIEDV